MSGKCPAKYGCSLNTCVFFLHSMRVVTVFVTLSNIRAKVRPCNPSVMVFNLWPIFKVVSWPCDIQHTPYPAIDQEHVMGLETYLVRSFTTAYSSRVFPCLRDHLQIHTKMVSQRRWSDTKSTGGAILLLVSCVHESRSVIIEKSLYLYIFCNDHD